jgi:uncharacterized protein (TIGR02284 family)
MLNQDRDVSVLNSLIETTIDSVDGYRRSAEEATDGRFASLFRQRAAEREQVVARLRDKVSELGGEARDDGSILGAMHRQFLSLRDAVTGSDDHSVIAEVDRGESYLNAKWEAALADDALSAGTKQLIRELYQSVRAGHEQWEAMHRAVDATG